MALSTTEGYYIRINGQEAGPYTLEALRRIPQFTLQTPLRTTYAAEWKPAFMVIDLRAYMTRPARRNEYSPLPNLPLAMGGVGKPSRWYSFKRLLGKTVLIACLGALGWAGYRWHARGGTIPLRLPAVSVNWRALGHAGVAKAIKALQDLDYVYFSPGPRPRFMVQPAPRLAPALKAPAVGLPKKPVKAKAVINSPRRIALKSPGRFPS